MLEVVLVVLLLLVRLQSWYCVSISLKHIAKQLVCLLAIHSFVRRIVLLRVDIVLPLCLWAQSAALSGFGDRRILRHCGAVVALTPNSAQFSVFSAHIVRVLLDRIVHLSICMAVLRLLSILQMHAEGSELALDFRRYLIEAFLCALEG